MKIARIMRTSLNRALPGYMCHNSYVFGGSIINLARDAQMERQHYNMMTRFGNRAQEVTTFKRLGKEDAVSFRLLHP